MTSFASELYNIRRKLVMMRSEQRETAAQLEARKTEIARTVEGKNAEERKVNLASEIQQDETCQSLQYRLNQIADEIALAEVDEQAIQDERREQEWATRLRMAEALAGSANRPAGPAVVTDAQVQQAVDDASVDDLFQEPREPTPDYNGHSRNRPLPADDEIPF
jgi:hypothetical protein